MTLEDATRLLEERDVRLAAALDALAGVVDLVDAIGGYLAPIHQQKLLDAKFRLEHEGCRNRPSQTWRDR